MTEEKNIKRERERERKKDNVSEWDRIERIERLIDTNKEVEREREKRETERREG